MKTVNFGSGVIWLTGWWDDGWGQCVWGGGQTGETAAPWLFMGGREDPFIIDYTV